jgi:outer membrane protein TolC
MLMGLALMGSFYPGLAGVSLAERETSQQTTLPLPATLVLTLRGALAAAVDNNPDVLIYKERIEAARGQVQTQLGAMLPNLSSNIRQTKQTQFLGTFGLSAVRTNPFSIFDARLNASQNVLSMSLIQRWRASRETLHATEFESDIRMANERQQIAAAQYEVQRATFNLANLLGFAFEIPLSLTDEFQPEVREVPAPQGAVEEALGNRPEVQAQYTRVRAMELNYSSITGERLPSLVAQGDYGLIGNRWNNRVDTYNMALLLQIPIFDGAQREGRIAESRSQLRQEALRMRSVVNQVKMEVHDAVASLAAAKEQVGMARIGMQAATKELELAKERYAVMTAASHFELTNGLYSLARARENLVNALFQLNAARVNLARSTGSLNTLK